MYSKSGFDFIGLQTGDIIPLINHIRGQSQWRKHYACAGVLLGGHVRAVFTVVLVIFLICVAITLTSFKEIPLDVLTAPGIRVSRGGRGLQRDVVYLGWPIAPSCMSPNAGSHLSQWVQLFTGAHINFGDLTPSLTYERWSHPITKISATCFKTEIGYI